MGVKVSQRLHCAPIEWQIANVAMLEGPHIAEVEGRAGED
jgi:hypothetical protein